MEVIAVRANGGQYRHSSATAQLPGATALKRQTLFAQDSLVAEDITDFPALNVANAISRVPGISITREWGEGRQISLRGLAADFTRVQINGMETLGTSSSPMDARGALSRSRAFDFNIFAAELFNQIEVKKSYSAEQEEGGIAGTINLRTAKPFDYAADKVAIAAQLSSNSNANNSLSGADPRFALGIEPDMERIMAAHELYKKVAKGARDDAMAMQYLVPGWQYDPKRPSLGRD